MMQVIILGSGRVGAAIAQELSGRGHGVTVIDQDPDSLIRLGGDDFPGNFLVGQGLDSELLERAGIEQADAFIASTDDDNANVVVSQVAQRRYGVGVVVVRVFDPEKAAFYAGRGLRVVCPTLRAIGEMIAAVDRGADPEPDPEAGAHDAATQLVDAFDETAAGAATGAAEQQ